MTDMAFAIEISKLITQLERIATNLYVIDKELEKMNENKE